MSSYSVKNKDHNDGEFLWLVSLSDLMILLFVFFVVLFSFSFQKIKQQDMQKMSEVISGVPQKSTLDEMQAKLLKWVMDKKLLSDVTIEQKQDALILQIKEKLLFSSGSFKLNSQSLNLIPLLGQTLEQIPAPYRIGIEGHTDDLPIKSELIKDNWSLSFHRAHSVLQALALKEEVRKRTVILSYGSMKPLVEVRSEDGKIIPENLAKNRRVTIRIF